MVLTTEPDNHQFPPEVIVAKSLQEALEKLQEPALADVIENVWIVGGYSVYKEAMESPMCGRIYLTRVFANFECDAFFPNLNEDFKQVPNDEDIPADIQEENGIKYQYQVYEKNH